MAIIRLSDFAGVLQNLGRFLGRLVQRRLRRLVSDDRSLQLRIDDVRDLDPFSDRRDREGVLRSLLECGQHFLFIRVVGRLLDVPFPDCRSGWQRAMSSLDLLAIVVGQPKDERRRRILVLAGFGHREAMASRPSRMFPRRSSRLNNDADIAGHFRFLADR